LDKIAEHLNIELTGMLLAYEGCDLATVSQKVVSKTMNTKATTFCERIFGDGTGPFQTMVSGHCYWYPVMDGSFGKGKYLNCNAAGENEKPLKKMCQQHGIIMEKTVPDTPQQNGVMERHTTLIRQRAHAQLLSASLDEETRCLLWAASVEMANTLESITATTKSAIYADELALYRKAVKIIPVLKGIWSDWNRVHPTEVQKQVMSMVRYVEDSLADTY
jgi:hypothetical protein